MIPGETEGYIREAGGLNTSSSYHVMLTTTTGIEAPSCPFTPSVSNKSFSFIVYPNPAGSNQLIQVEIGLQDDEWSNEILILHDIQGKTLYKTEPVKGTNIITTPAGSGLYVLSLYVGNSLVASEKIVVED